MVIRVWRAGRSSGQVWIGIRFHLFQVSPLVLEASSQWDEGTRDVPGSSHAGYGTIRTTVMKATMRIVWPHRGHARGPISKMRRNNSAENGRKSTSSLRIGRGGVSSRYCVGGLGC